MVILFYAFTELQIINCINLKKTIYPSMDADIYIPESPRISSELAPAIENQHIFRKVIIINRWNLLTLILSCNPVNLYLISHNMTVIWPFSLPRLLSTGNYSKIIVSGFWDKSLFIIHYISSISKCLEIEFLEEGLVNYIYQKNDLGLSHEGKRQQLIWTISTLTNRSTCARSYLSFVKDMYLYCPQAGVAKDIMLRQLPALMSDVVPMNIWGALLHHVDLNLYRGVKVIYFAQDQICHPGDYNIFCEELMCISKIFGDNVLIKAHPAFPLKDISSIGNYLVDNSGCSFEALLNTLDLSSTLLITRNSSCVFTTKFMFKQDIPTILTFKLYECGIPDPFFKAVEGSNNFFVPKNLDDFMSILSAYA